MPPARYLDSPAMADLKPLYLISGEDDAKIDAWRLRVRNRAEREGGAGALEAFDARAQTPADVAAAVSALSFAEGTRFVLADGVEAWKAPALETLLRQIADMPPDTVLVLIARGKAPGGLVKALEKAGGEARDYPAPKPWELPKWVIERARDEGLHLDSEAAKVLVQTVGARQQRLAREIEKLSVAAHPRGQLTADEVVRLATGEASLRAYDLADALVAGDAVATLALAEELHALDERPAKLIYPIVRRLREVARATELIDSGTPEKGVGAAMKMPPWVAKRVVAQARGADREAIEQALTRFADLEFDLRQGGLDEDTALTLTLARATV